MIFTDIQVWEAVKAIAPKFDLDPYLIMAICEQECEHRIGKRGARVFDITKYDCGIPRMEPAFYDRYTRDFEYSTVIESLLAESYGTMQMMGESLRECKDESGKNYFERYFEQQNESWKLTLLNSMSPINVVLAIDSYCTDLNTMIEWGCRWFCKKLVIANNDVNKALVYWNGSDKYPGEVLDRIQRLKKVLIT